jgi:cell division protein ZapA (FtsZ GTPase activity inhibitor)
MDKVSANIVIAGRIYPMKVSVESEEGLREAERLIRNEMNVLSIYKDQDIEDRLSVTLLTIAVRLIESQKQNKIHCSEIEKIDRKLGIYLERQGSLDDIE